MSLAHKLRGLRALKNSLTGRVDHYIDRLFIEATERVPRRIRRCRVAPQRIAASPVQGAYLGLENLERRELLAADVIINEFLSRNDGGARDGNGRTSDWVELFNGGDEMLDLSGYRLTDDPDDLSKWVFPSRELHPGDYMAVFASGQDADDYVDSAGYLHTNFTLRRSGDYLALVSPDNAIVTEFGSRDEEFPEQKTNVSYGGAQSLQLISSDSDAYYFVPSFDPALDAVWNTVDFDAEANGFALGTGSFGYETRPTNRTNFVDAFATEVPDTTISLYTRFEFEIGSASAISNLNLSMNYDNGFVAYLNGVKVAEAHAPENLSGFSTATDSRRRDSEALIPVDFDLTDSVGALVDGKNVLAIHGLNHLNDASDFLLVPRLSASASDLETVLGKPANVGFMEPTFEAPNVSNDEVFDGWVGDTSFSVDRGFYNEPVEVEVSVDDEGAQIYYTTDGSIPTPSNGTLYTEPLAIDSLTTLRASAHKERFIPSNTDTQTYVFIEEVFNQDGSDLESTRWGHAGPDWEMDPDVINHPDPESRPELSDLLTLRTISLVMDWDEMFGSDGIYIRGESVEIGTSVELLNPDGSEEGFQIDGSVQIVGGTSPNRWKSDKLSMRLKFNNDFGSGDLEYPVFGEEEHLAQEFDTLVLDAHLNNVWHYGGGSSPTSQQRWAQYLRDMYAADMQLALGGYATHDEHVFVYINGVFWGMHRLHERPDDNFAASYLGGDNEDYDVIKHSAGDVISGTNDNYLELFQRSGQDMSDPANYQAVVDMLDVDDFINYMIMNYYGGNMDWSHHNWYASYNRVDPNGKWRFHSWDAEKVLQGVTDDKTTDVDNRTPTGLFHDLIDNPEFRLRFADLVQEHMTNDGALTPENAAALYQIRLDQIDRAIRVESARWGDNQRPNDPYTRGDDWVAERDRLLGTYFPRRTDIVLRQFERRGWLPDVDAPELNQHGGAVDVSFNIELSAPEGTIYYTTNGNDPRLTGGAIANDALAYTGAFQLLTDSTVNARALHDGEWSALTQAEFTIGVDIPLPGDSNGDGLFNQLDIVAVLQAGKYLTGEPATFAEGDWNNDGLFNQLDLVAAQQTGQYLQGQAVQSLDALAVNAKAKKEDNPTDIALQDLLLI